MSFVMLDSVQKEYRVAPNLEFSGDFSEHGKLRESSVNFVHCLGKIVTNKIPVLFVCRTNVSVKLLFSTSNEQSRAFLPARRYASAGYRDRNVSVCPSVRASVCHAPVLCQNEEC